MQQSLLNAFFLVSQQTTFAVSRYHTDPLSDLVFTNELAIILLVFILLIPIAVYIIIGTRKITQLLIRRFGKSTGLLFAITIACTINFTLIFLSALPFKNTSVGEEYYVLILFYAGSILSSPINIAIWYGLISAIYRKHTPTKLEMYNETEKTILSLGLSRVNLEKTVYELFMRYQEDWSRRDPSQFSDYMTSNYATYTSLMIEALTDLKRFNVTKKVTILKITIQDITIDPVSGKVTMKTLINAKAKREIIDEDTGRISFTKKSSFSETWHFTRNDSNWLLSYIRQETTDLTAKQIGLIELANQNNLFYALHYGRLLIPRRGRLLKSGKLGYYNIYNHVIGKSGDKLIQLYTYISDQNYLVGQINTTHEYSDVLIKPKGMFSDIKPPRGYKKYEPEWASFNNRYSVYTIDGSYLSKFELLNPGFMTILYDNFTKINIEVIDNIIYFYIPMLGQLDDYSKLLRILTLANKELS